LSTRRREFSRHSSRIRFSRRPREKALLVCPFRDVVAFDLLRQFIVTSEPCAGKATNIFQNSIDLSVIVVERGCVVKAFQNEDGSSMVRFEMAFGKAYAALALGRSSSLVRVRNEEKPAFMRTCSTPPITGFSQKVAAC
jgi:hypothetical protein